MGGIQGRLLIERGHPGLACPEAGSGPWRDQVHVVVWPRRQKSRLLVPKNSERPLRCYELVLLEGRSDHVKGV
jgi:hypothetical protein